MRNPESESLSDASELELELIEKLRGRRVQRSEQQAQTEQVQPERTEQRSNNITLPIPIRHNPNNFFEFPHFPLSTMGNPPTSNFTNVNQQQQGNQTNSDGRPNQMYYPPMGFFPFGFFY